MTTHSHVAKTNILTSCWGRYSFNTLASSLFLSVAHQVNSDTFVSFFHFVSFLVKVYLHVVKCINLNYTIWSVLTTGYTYVTHIPKKNISITPESPLCPCPNKSFCSRKKHNSDFFHYILGLASQLCMLTRKTSYSSF